MPRLATLKGSYVSASQGWGIGIKQDKTTKSAKQTKMDLIVHGKVKV